MTRTLNKALVALTITTGIAVAQSNFVKPRIAGQVIASQFGQWSSTASGPIISSGSPQTVTLESRTFTLPDSTPFSPLAVGTAIAIFGDASPETVIPTSVNCASGGAVCTFAAVFAHAHPSNFMVSSGTDGLQEAINAALATGGTVVVTPDWIGTTAQITGATGSATVEILDQRQGQYTWYGWTGSVYQAAWSINAPPPGITSFSSIHPAITPTSIEGTLYADQFTGAKASTATTTGSIGASSTSLTLASAQDFANEQGILVAGAGAAVTLTTPATPTVVVTGSTNAQSCTYAIAALDGALGETAASPATASENCGGVGGSTSNVISTYNTLSWTPVTGAEGYVVYENSGSGYAVAQIVSIPANVPWWTSGSAYALGQLIQPRGPQYNGWFYKATVAGTSGGSQPAWCTTSGCTVTDNGVTWTAQSFSWHDDGRNWAWFGIKPNIPTIPAAPPAAAVNDALVTTITSGGGTTALTLGASATAPVTGAYVGHDNTAAFNAAFAAQNSACASTQLAAGSASFGTCPSVVVPAGTYLISSPLTVAGAYSGIRGTDQSIIEQINPVADVLVYTNAYQETLDSLTVIGGKQQVLLNNGTQDNIKITLERLQLEWANDYAVAAFNNVTSSDFHLSSSVTIAGSKFLANQGEFYDYGDRADWSANWSETLPSQQSLMWGQGQIVMAEPGGALKSSASEYIPDAATTGGSPGGVPQGEHWIEDWWQLFSNGDRFSGESGGGYPCVYYEGGFPAVAPNLGITAGGSISLTNDWLFCGGSSYGPGSGKVFLANGLPMTTVMTDDYGFSEPLFTIAPGNNIDVGLLPTMKTTPVNPNPAYSTLGAINIEVSPNVGMTGCNASWNSLVLQFPSVGLWFPAALVPYIAEPECRLLASNPTDGYWGINEKGFYQNRGGGVVGVRGFVSVRNGLAAPVWSASTSYAVGSFVVASPDNLHVFEATTAGTSGGSQPSWNTVSGGTTADGSVVWTEEGQSAAFAPLGPAMSATGEGDFVTTSALNPALTAKAASGQVADTFDVYNSSGVIQAGVNASGVVNANNGINVGGGQTISNSNNIALTSQLPLIGSVSGSTTLLAANSCGDTVTTTVTGATTSMVAKANSPAAFPAASNGLIVQAAVTSANTISVGYCNVTTSGITPAAATIQVRVIQ